MLRPSSCQVMLCALLCGVCCQQYRLPVTAHASTALCSLTTCTQYAVIAQQAPRHAWHQQPLTCQPAAEAIMQMQRLCICCFSFCWIIAADLPLLAASCRACMAAAGAAQLCLGCPRCCLAAALLRLPCLLQGPWLK